MNPIRTLPGCSGLTGRSESDDDDPRAKTRAAGRWAVNQRSKSNEKVSFLGIAIII
jgi:hypothetical protein